MKKILSIVIAVFLLIGVFSTGVSALAAGKSAQETADVLDTAMESSEIDVQIKDAETEAGTFPVVSIVLFAVGGVTVAGLSAAFVIWNLRSSKKEKNSFKYTFQALSVVAVAILFFGNAAVGLVAGSVRTNELMASTYYNGSFEPSTTETDPVKGYTESLPGRKVLATFENGLDAKYNMGGGARSPHYWTDDAPEYSAQTPEQGIIAYDNSEGLADDYNCWTVLPGEGECTAEYRFTYRATDNYEDTTFYDRLRIVYCGEGKGTVNLTVYADTRRETKAKVYELGTVEVKGGEKKEISFNLGVIPAEDRPYLDRLCFVTDCSKLQSSVVQKLYYIDMYSEETYKRNDITIGDLSIDSEYLGSTQFMLYGAYSPSGFYDTSDGKWKVWFGAGIPEGIASDNVYYAETSDPRMGWSQPIRLVLDDPTNKLYPYNRSPGYGGDPAVIKVDGTYYMYFSGLETSAISESGGHWNKIYLATSKDGLNFTVQKCVVDVPNGGQLGYGAGSPSVVYKDGKFYLYFYTQTPVGSNNAQGVVLSVSEDPMSFTEFKACPTLAYGAADVKWIPSLNIWVATGYTEGGSVNNVYIAYSKDGITFTLGLDEKQRPAQPFYEPDIHNPGWLGTEEGFGYENMFLLYGVNDMSLRDVNAAAQMDSRQMEWTRVSFSLNNAKADSNVSAQNTVSALSDSQATSVIQTNKDIRLGNPNALIVALTIGVNVLGGLVAAGAVVTGIIGLTARKEEEYQE